MASTDKDSDEDEDEEDRDNPKAPSLGQFRLNDGWQRKGTREMKRERRTRSEGAARRAETL